MDPMVTAALVQTGGSLLSNLFGKKSSSGPSIGEQLEAQRDNQLKYDRSSIKQKVIGAREAGIHPLAALGIPTTGGFTAQAFGGDGPDKMADALTDMGQGASRALQAYATREERALTRASAELSLENQKLQNDRLRSEIALMTSPGSPPGFSTNMAIPGQGDSQIENIPTQITGQSMKNPDYQVGIAPTWRGVQYPGSHRVIVPSDEMLRVMESDPTQIPSWYINMLLGGIKKSGKDTGRWLRRKWENFKDEWR